MLTEQLGRKPSTVGLATDTRLFRVQSKILNDSLQQYGPMRLSKAGKGWGRYTPSNAVVAYFALEADTSIFEALCRRDLEEFITPDRMRTRELVWVRTTRRMQLFKINMLDLNRLPKLASARYRGSQELALAVMNDGRWDGIEYPSVQHPMARNVALFESAFDGLVSEGSSLLINRNGRLLHHLADAMARAGLQFLSPP